MRKKKQKSRRKIKSFGRRKKDNGRNNRKIKIEKKENLNNEKVMDHDNEISVEKITDKRTISYQKGMNI